MKAKKRIKLAQNNLQVNELLIAMFDDNKAKAAEARTAVAINLLTPAIRQVVDTAPVMSNLFEQELVPDGYSYPVDMFYNVTNENFFVSWSSNQNEEMPQKNKVVPSLHELKFDTFILESSVYFGQKHARQNIFGMVEAAINRMAQEILLKQDRNAARVLMHALANAVGPDGSTKHIVRTNTADTFIISDINRLISNHDRINAAWDGGTPNTEYAAITDLYISPEVFEQVRSWAFNPQNTKGTASDIPATEQMRNDLYRNAGNAEFWGVSLNKLFELGVGKKYNTMFAAAAGVLTYPGYGGGAASGFNPATEEIMIAVDRSKGVLKAPVVSDGDYPGPLTIRSNNDIPENKREIGWYGGKQIGALVADDRVLAGIIV